MNMKLKKKSGFKTKPFGEEPDWFQENLERKKERKKEVTIMLDVQLVGHLCYC